MVNRTARIVVALTGLLIMCLAGCDSNTCTAPCSRPGCKNEYLPLAVGNEWTYRQAESGYTSLAAADPGHSAQPDTFYSSWFWHITSEAIDEAGNAWFGCKQDNNMDRPPSQYFVVRPDSSIWLGFHPDYLSTMILPGHPEEGYEWTDHGDWTWRVLGDTTVVVPAGVFRCISVAGGYMYGAGYAVFSYASGIGLVSHYHEGEHGWVAWDLSSYRVR